MSRDIHILTEADIAMLAHAMQSGAARVDYSEFYCEDED